jgi:ethylbenzene dioxygenase ferredoxin subunit
MMEAVRVCKVEDVQEGEPMPAEVPGLPELAIYNVGGEYFATDNHCTHGNALLTDGYQEEARIECPFHGGAFDIRSGAPVTFPCQIALRTYQVRVEDGWIAVVPPAEVAA